MKSLGIILIEIIDKIKPLLDKISDRDASIKPAPEKWSKKEILGHLIDSAVNNHRRFILANFKDNLIFEGYRQEEWVSIQGYQNRNWRELIVFWAAYNQHIANIIEQTDDGLKSKKHTIHSFDSMAFVTVPKVSEATLNYLIKDYVGHLEHHIQQILPDYTPVVSGTY